MLCNCDCGEKFTAMSFASAFTEWISSRRTERVMLNYAGEYCEYGEYCDARDA